MIILLPFPSCATGTTGRLDKVNIEDAAHASWQRLDVHWYYPDWRAMLLYLEAKTTL